MICDLSKYQIHPTEPNFNCESLTNRAAGRPCANLVKTNGPYGIDHTIATDFSMTVGKYKINIVKTNRTFSATYGMDYWVPAQGTWKVFERYWNPTVFILNCDVKPENADRPYLEVKEDCTIINSKIHYIDQRYDLAFIKRTTNVIKLTLSSNKIAGFRPAWGNYWNMGLITQDDYSGSNITTDWILIKDGEENIISSEKQDIHPFGPENNGLSFREINPSYTGLFPDFKPDKKVRKVLLFPDVNSMLEPYTDYVCRLGFYDYGGGVENTLNMLDGGNKDMFYPEWCRGLAYDPIWAKVARDRFMASWYRDSPVTKDNYAMPEVLVEPIPIGSFVRHPKIGDVYQWLLDKGKIHTKPDDLSSFVDKSLSSTLSGYSNLKDSKKITYEQFENKKTELTRTKEMLYYPIGLV